MEAAVLALMMLPATGIQPIRNWDTVRPMVVVATDAMAARAMLSVSSNPKTLPKAMVMVVWMAPMGTLSLPGIWARPAPTAPADAPAEWMMAWHCARWLDVM